MGEVRLGLRPPIGGQLIAAKEPRRATARGEHTGTLEAGEADVVGERKPPPEPAPASPQLERNDKTSERV